MSELSQASSPASAQKDFDYRDILNTIDDGFALIDRNFIIVDVNSEVLRRNQKTREQMVGRSPWEAWPEIVNTIVEAIFRQVMQDRIPQSFVFEYPFPAGASWLEIRAFPVKDGMSIFARDVTRAEQARVRLQESDDRFRAAIMATGVMWTNNEEGKMSGEQPSWSALTGQTQAEYQGHGWAAAIHPDDVEPTITGWNKAVAERRTFVGEQRVRCHDAVFRNFLVRAVPVIDNHGVVREWVGVHTDITERKKSERELSMKEARLRLATNAVGMGIFAWDAQSDALVFENERLYEILGIAGGVAPVTAEAWIEQFFYPDDASQIRYAVKKALAGIERLRFQGRIVRPHDNVLRWIEVHGEQFEIDGTGMGFICSVTDITERKRGEEALKAKAEALESADRHKTEFIATVAHELRNPLAPIKNAVQLLRVAPGNINTVSRVTAVLDRQVGQMVHLIEDLLDITRISRGEISVDRKTVDLREIIAAAVEASLPFIETGLHDFQVDVSDESMVVMADPNRIAQVISNLLNNAAKYTPSGGKISLTASCREQQVNIMVLDTGIGIPAASLAAIFDMFTQVGEHGERAQGGLGIGLALVRTIVNLHGGTVSAFSAGLGMGSSFQVALPLAAIGSPEWLFQR